MSIEHNLVLDGRDFTRGEHTRRNCFLSGCFSIPQYPGNLRKKERKKERSRVGNTDGGCTIDERQAEQTTNLKFERILRLTEY